jgi:mRNA-degrading endonuclease HigB of HigAB toxin-antitoxin module
VRLIGRAKLMALSRHDRDTAKWIASWIAELRDAHWKRPTDVSRQFPKACQQNDGTFLFPVPQRQLGIHVLIAFSQDVALIVAIRVFEIVHEH